MQDIKAYSLFLRDYAKSRFITFGKGIEGIKNIIVAFLIVKRGKYSNSFLNTSFFLLVAAVLIGAPTIAENNPFLNSLSSSETTAQAAVVSYNPYENPLSTVISSKPREANVEYIVKSGDTLESIAKTFGSTDVDSIKWASDIKSDSLKTGQKLSIPPIKGVVVKVVAGENIYTIAKKYKTDAQKIVNFPFNQFEDLDTFQLTSGQTLYVPDGVIEEEQPKYESPNYNAIAQIQAGVQGTSNFIWPTTGMVTQYPIWYHMALDIANPKNPPVIAADSGTVSYSGCIDWGYGCHVIINHGNGFQTLYGHMVRGSILVSTGQNVSKGQQIGNMGSTGRSTGTHLHFEIRVGGVTQNPLNYLK